MTHAVKYGGSTEREKARTKLLLSNLRLLMKVAGEFNNRGLSREELINEGSFGLLDAAERFRPGGGARFSSYSVWRIRQVIRRALARQGRTVRIPLRTLENLYRMRRIEREFLNTYGRTPDMAELADLLGCSSVVLKELKHVESYSMTSIDSGRTEDGASLLDRLPELAENPPDEQYIYEEAKELLYEALKLLSDRERQMVEMRYGLNGDGAKTLEEISYVFNCTREAVRKSLAKAIRKMQQVYDLGE